MNDGSNLSQGQTGCAEIREIVSAAIDDETNQAEILVLDRHLEDCEDCARYAMQVAYLQNVLPEQLSDDADAQAIWARAQRIIDLTEPAAETRTAQPVVPRRKLIRYGLAASLAFAVGGTGYLGYHMASSSNVLSEAVNDHLTFRASGKKLHIRDSRQDVVTRWLEDRIDFDVAVRSAAPAGFDLVGGRLCSFLGRRLVFLHYKKGVHDASLYIMRDDKLRLPAPHNRSAGGRDLLVESLQGVTSAAWRQAGLIYVVVANMDADALLDFASDV